ncbi:MAG TPA: DUF1501 domain-containing protein [Planctomycetaceae bacterium]|nr:DUF1501 domain-containing protein [Planctomycetaceae bacterium]
MTSRLCDYHRQMNRRELLQVGGSAALGVGLTSVLGDTARANDSIPAKAKSVIVIHLTGAASHHDTFDMKPAAPKEIRGEFAPIDTAIPGFQICEHLPQLARRSDKYAVIRTLSHGDNNHLMSTHHVLTGTKQPGGFFDKVASRDDWPAYAAGLAYLKPRRDGLPTGVNLPTYLMQGALTWPGQHAGFLGPKYDPWQITGDPNNKDFRVDSLTLSEGISINRLKNRASLLAQLNTQRVALDQLAETKRLADDQRLAFSLLSSSKLAAAFEMQREADDVRDRYGRHTTGQSLLLAKRLIQTGIPVVQVNVGGAQTWDNHGDIFNTLKNRLLPPLDQGLSALLDDLHDEGLIDETLVFMSGEFGRTPKINGGAGRDHWGPCFFGLFAGAGVQTGQVIGVSDAEGGYPATKAYAPDDVGATVYASLGIDPHTVVRDRLNRPIHLNAGTPIAPLFTGASI